MAFMSQTSYIPVSLQYGTSQPSTSAKGAVVRNKRRAFCGRKPLIASATEAATGAKADARGRKDSGLSYAQVEEWGRVRERLEEVLSVDDVTADKLVACAFGWENQTFWRLRELKQPPSLSVVDQSLDFLTNEIGIDAKDLLKVIKDFPEVLALKVSQMQSNVSYMSEMYPRLKGKLLAEAVIDNPAVLGYDYDCEWDCQSECARCWTRFSVL